MPEKSQSITVAGRGGRELQAIAYGAFQQLNWKVKYAGDNVLLGYTEKGLTRYDNEIKIKTADGEITVSSKMIHGEVFDMMGRTKKDISKFLEAFEAVKNTATSDNTNEWIEKISLLKQETITAANEELRQTQEVDEVMNLSKGSRVITYGIIAINALVFVLMVASGVSIFSPSGADIIKWGANFGPLTLSGDWWRLITCVFVHIGIIHIAFNMYALFMVGVYLEPMLGKVKYITAYLCTGIFASLASLWWHKEPIASAGASGAIFGMFGVFLALLSTNLIPKQARNSLLQSIAIFVVYNLAYGMKSGVDNSAHVGGLLSGLLIGYLYYPGLRSGTKKSMAIAGVLILLTVAVAGFYLRSNQSSIEMRNQTQTEIENDTHKDTNKFREQLNEIVEIEKMAIAPFNDSLTDAQLAEKLQTVSLPGWEKADEIAKKMEALEISAKLKQKAVKLQQYIAMRKAEIDAVGQLASKEDSASMLLLSKTREKINQIAGELGQP